MAKQKINKEVLDRVIKEAKEARERLRSVLKSTSQPIGSHQPSQEAPFQKDILTANNLLIPKYNAFDLYEIVENSTVLGTCIEAYVVNVHGFGHEFAYKGERGKQQSEEVLAEKKMLEDFFEQVNESQSFSSLREELGRDYETTGRCFIEVVRYPDGDIATLYRADARYVYLQKKQDEPVEIEVELMRGGRLRKTRILKRFRRYAMTVGRTTAKLRWFKEYGDPRVMCAVTGKYEDELEKGESIIEPASEIIHIKQGNDVYGVPRWIGIATTVLGLNQADFVNYDLFENQVVPPLAILVSGGVLTKEAIEDIEQVLLQKKGVENFNKIVILEAVPFGEDYGLEDKKTTVKLDIKELSAARKEDSMFNRYVELAEKRIRSKFRLPPLYLGMAEEYSRSTADASKLTAESQVFAPERKKFDEIINFTIMRDLGAKYWKFKTIGPRMIEGGEAIDAFWRFARAGVITINQGIKIANHVLGLDAPLYEDAWANYPIQIVLELVKQGVIKGLGEISVLSPDNLDDVANKLEKVKKEYQDDEEIVEAVDKTIKMINDLKKEVEQKLSSERVNE